jgi:hypothetical protein
MTGCALACPRTEKFSSASFVSFVWFVVHLLAGTEIQPVGRNAASSSSHGWRPSSAQ